MKLSVLTFACFLLFSTLPFGLFAQVDCTQADRQKLVTILEKGKKMQWQNLPMGELIVAVGKEFLGIEYVASTLEVNGVEEKLVVNLHGLDCTTFLENTVALAKAIKKQEWSEEKFFQLLEAARYRGGKRDGYPSRLHYFSEWLTDNETRGQLTILRGEAGAQVYMKNLDFMSTHRDKYAPLADDKVFENWVDHEKKLTGSPIWYIPKQQIQTLEGQIQNGDLLALTTSLDGLDVTHVGIAIKQNGRLHLLEASTISKKVSISPQPLAETLAPRKITTGIIVARLKG